MTFFKALSIFLATAAAVHAKPISDPPSKAVPRADPPKPSSYPLGDACTNEWKYLNFDPKDATDKAHLKQLHGSICDGDIMALASHGARAAIEGFKPYLRYFTLNEEQDGDEREDELYYQKHVDNVLSLISGDNQNGVTIGAVVKDFIVDNKDFGANVPGGSKCDDEGTLAYTLVDTTVDDREKIHFCDTAWTGLGKTVEDIDCNALDAYPSDKMDIFPRIVLHEMTHYSTVGPETSLEDMIMDRKNADEEYAYGPERAHGLNDPDQDDDALAAVLNADNYAWMALDTYVSRICMLDVPADEWQDFFTEDPPEY